MFGNAMLDMIFGPWAANTLYCANRLDIFNRLAEKELTLEELAQKVNAVPGILKAVLDACTAMGFLQFKDNRYCNSQISNIYLRESMPQYLGDITYVMALEAGNWEGLYDLVKGNPKTAKSNDALALEPWRFTMAMNNIAMLGEAHALANAVNLENRKQLTDVGCGSGIYSISLCQRFSHLKATLLDRKEVLETTRKQIAKNNLQHRIVTREGDITSDSYGKEPDVILLSDVLYHERSICQNILQRAYDALTPGGVLLIRGYYSDPGNSNHGNHGNLVFGSLFNIKLLLDDSNREIITVSVLTQWLEQTGFTDIHAFPLTEKSTCFTAGK